MIFLSNEKDLILNKNCILYFYSSEQIDSIGKMMYKVVSELGKTFHVLCVDIGYFNNMHKRFDIKEIPTILLIEDGQEKKRINGMPSENDINNILVKD